VSPYGSDFNRDYGLSFTRDELARGGELLQVRRRWLPKRRSSWAQCVLEEGGGGFFHTYSTFARDSEIVVNSYNTVLTC